MSGAGAYRFGQLGSLQFGALCDALLGADPDERSASEVTTRLFADRESAPRLLDGLELPVLVVTAWLRAREGRAYELGRIVAVAAADAPAARSILVLSNAGALVPEPPAADLPVSFVGAEQLAALIEGDPRLRLHVPTVLGIRDLDDVLGPAVVARSTLDLGAARELAPVFVVTGAYRQTLDVLERRRFAVITGPPEMGKTAIARTVALARMTDGWDAHECIRPEQLWAAYDRERRQVFVADDAFGSTEYRPDAAERWTLQLPRILQAMDDRHWLLWTSRPAPLRAGLRRIHREHGLERFPSPVQVQVDATALTVAEKALILFRHTKATDPEWRQAMCVQQHGWAIVDHPHFTPERIRRFVRTRLAELSDAPVSNGTVARAVDAEIREPTGAMATSLAALDHEQRALLVALLDTPPGPAAERDLAAALRRHLPDGASHAPADIVDRLTDHFVRIVPSASVTWVHPSWRDLVISTLVADPAARRRFLERTGLEGLLLAISVGGGVAGERTLPLLCADADWDAATTRISELAADFPAPSAIRLLDSLAAALAAELAPHERAEAVALAGFTLGRLARAWDAGSGGLPATALVRWCSLAERLAEPPPLPRIDRTWFELVPGEHIDIDARDEVVRLDEWLALVEAMQAYARDDLARLGFPLDHHRMLEQFLRSARFAPASLGELVAGVLERIERVTPGHAYAARTTAVELLREGDPWFAVRLPTVPRRPERRSSDRELVDRVLRDL